jgi:leader peptidase (prepilin peptidase)/N-methyltransferase
LAEKQSKYSKMEIPLTVFFTLLGLAIGSFLNVCIDRLPAGRSLAYPPSHCDACQHRLSPGDLIPVFSYLRLRGRCRYCRAPIPRRVLLVEVLSGAYFFLAFWRLGLGAEFAVTAFWGCVFLIIMFIDWEHKLILNKVTYPMAVAAVVILAINSLWPGAGLLSQLRLYPEPSILSGVIGGVAGFIFFFVVFFISPRGMGAGDVKMAGLIGLVVGFPLVIVALLIGIFIGGLVAFILLLSGLKTRKDVMPYGTFLAIGPLVTLLWGNDIFSWYLGRF